MERLFTTAKATFVGVPYGEVKFLEAGTSNLKKTYSDYALSVENTNPVQLDADGQAKIFLEPGFYDVEVYYNNGTLKSKEYSIRDIAAVSAIPPSSALVVNLAPNSEFNDVTPTGAPDKWSVINASSEHVISVTVSAEHVPIGEYCTKITAVSDLSYAGPIGYSDFVSDYIPIDVSLPMEVSAKLYLESTETYPPHMGIVLRVTYYDDLYNYLGVWDSSQRIEMASSQMNTWYTTSLVDVSPPLDAKYVKVSAPHMLGNIAPNTQPYSFFVDGVSVVQAKVISPIANTMYMGPSHNLHNFQDVQEYLKLKMWTGTLTVLVEPGTYNMSNSLVGFNGDIVFKSTDTAVSAVTINSSNDIVDLDNAHNIKLDGLTINAPGVGVLVNSSLDLVGCSVTVTDKFVHASNGSKVVLSSGDFKSESPTTQAATGKNEQAATYIDNGSSLFVEDSTITNLYTHIAGNSTARINTCIYVIDTTNSYCVTTRNSCSIFCTDSNITVASGGFWISLGSSIYAVDNDITITAGGTLASAIQVKDGSSCHSVNNTTSGGVFAHRAYYMSSARVFGGSHAKPNTPTVAGSPSNRGSWMS